MPPAPTLRTDWSTPRLTRLGAKAARMPDRTTEGEGNSGKSGKVFASF